MANWAMGKPGAVARQFRQGQYLHVIYSLLADEVMVEVSQEWHDPKLEQFRISEDGKGGAWEAINAG